MKKAFTMIELIFVIVIIGILAAVAIPKLSATRDDAKVSSIIANTKTVIQDVTSYFTAQGESGLKSASVSDVTDIPLYVDKKCEKQALNDTKIVDSELFICGDDAPVVYFMIRQTKMAVATDTGNKSNIAVTVRNSSAMKSIAHDYTFGESTVNR